MAGRPSHSPRTPGGSPLKAGTDRGKGGVLRRCLKGVIPSRELDFELMRRPSVTEDPRQA